MKSIVVLIAFSVVLGLVKGDSGDGPSKKVVCYRYGLEYYYKDSYNENCTHVVFRVGQVDRNTGKVKVYNTLYDLKRYKTTYPYLKLILGLDLSDNQELDLPHVLNSASGRRKIIQSAVDYINEKGYDGIDLAFKQKYVHQTAIVASGIRKIIGRNRTLSGIFLRKVSKDDFHITKLSEIAENLDFITFECYQTFKTKPYTELSAPLYSKDDKSVSRSIKWFLKMGAPRNKLLLGIQTYAVTYTLDDPDSNSIGSPSKEPGWLVPPGHSAGFLHLHQISEPLWVFDRDEISKAPFASNYLQWASFEDNVSISTKVQFAKEKHLSGIALTTLQWNDEYDRQLPFTKFVSELLNNEDSSSESDEGSDEINLRLRDVESNKYSVL